jgi:hypothetical protein
VVLTFFQKVGRGREGRKNKWSLNLREKIYEKAKSSDGSKWFYEEFNSKM